MSSPHSSSEAYAVYAETHSLPRKQPPPFIASFPQPFAPLVSPASDAESKKDPLGGEPTSLPPISVKESKRPVRLAIFSILLPSIAMFALLLILLVVLVAYIAVFHQATLDSSHILTTGKSTRVITITQIISKCVSSMIPMIMAIQAFSVAANWMKSSETDRVDVAKDRPTPVHLGLAISNLGSPTMLNLWSSVRYLFTFDAASRQQRQNNVATPAFFKRVVGLLFWVLLLDHLVGVADFALHVTASERQVPISFDYSSNGWTGDKMLLGRALNNTMCQESKASSQEYIRKSCGLENGSNNSQYLSIPQGTRAITNTSETNTVAYLDDSTAIIVTPEQPPFSYTTSSLGIRSSCKSITRDCVQCGMQTYEGYSYNNCNGSEASPNLNCKGPDNYNVTYVRIDGTQSWLQGLLDASGNSIVGSQVTTNPVNFGSVVSSFVYSAYENGTLVGDDNWNGDTGFLVHGHNGGYNVLFCELEALESIFRFDPPTTFTRLSDQKLDAATTAILTWNADRYLDRIASEVEGTGSLQSSTETYADAYARTLSKYSMALSSVVLEPIAVQSLNGAQQPGSQLSLIALACYIVLATLFALTILVSGLISFVSALRISSPSLPAIRSLFLSPLPTLRQLHGGASRVGAEALLSTNGVKLFAPEVEADRLSVATEWDGQSWVIATRKS